MPSKNSFGIALRCNDLGSLLTHVLRQTTLGRRQLVQRHVILVHQPFRWRSLLHRSYSANAALASSPFNLAARPRTWLLSSIFAMDSKGSLHMSITAVVFF